MGTIYSLPTTLQWYNFATSGIFGGQQLAISVLNADADLMKERSLQSFDPGLWFHTGGDPSLDAFQRS
jgi:hypothetical protein